MTITKEEFLKVYNANYPNKFIKFAYKYFSTDTINKDRWLIKIFTTVGLSTVFIGFIMTVMNMSHTLIGIITSIFIINLLIIAFIKSFAVIMNNIRLFKIKKQLHITTMQYDYYEKLYIE